MEFEQTHHLYVGQKFATKRDGLHGFLMCVQGLLTIVYIFDLVLCTVYDTVKDGITTSISQNLVQNYYHDLDGLISAQLALGRVLNALFLAILKHSLDLLGCNLVDLDTYTINDSVCTFYIPDLGLDEFRALIGLPVVAQGIAGQNVQLSLDFTGTNELLKLLWTGKGTTGIITAVLAHASIAFALFVLSMAMPPWRTFRELLRRMVRSTMMSLTAFQEQAALDLSGVNPGTPRIDDATVEQQIKVTYLESAHRFFDWVNPVVMAKLSLNDIVIKAEEARSLWLVSQIETAVFGAFWTSTCKGTSDVLAGIRSGAAGCARLYLIHKDRDGLREEPLRQLHSDWARSVLSEGQELLGASCAAFQLTASTVHKTRLVASKNTNPIFSQPESEIDECREGEIARQNILTHYNKLVQLQTTGPHRSDTFKSFVCSRQLRRTFIETNLQIGNAALSYLSGLSSKLSYVSASEIPSDQLVKAPEGSATMGSRSESFHFVERDLSAAKYLQTSNSTPKSKWILKNAMTSVVFVFLPLLIFMAAWATPWVRLAHALILPFKKKTEFTDVRADGANGDTSTEAVAESQTCKGVRERVQNFMSRFQDGHLRLKHRRVYDKFWCCLRFTLGTSFLMLLQTSFPHYRSRPLEMNVDVPLVRVDKVVYWSMLGFLVTFTPTAQSTIKRAILRATGVLLGSLSGWLVLICFPTWPYAHGCWLSVTASVVVFVSSVGPHGFHPSWGYAAQVFLFQQTIICVESYLSNGAYGANDIAKSRLVGQSIGILTALIMGSFSFVNARLSDHTSRVLLSLGSSGQALINSMMNNDVKDDTTFKKCKYTAQEALSDTSRQLENMNFYRTDNAILKELPRLHPTTRRADASFIRRSLHWLHTDQKYHELYATFSRMLLYRLDELPRINHRTKEISHDGPCRRSTECVQRLVVLVGCLYDIAAKFEESHDDELHQNLIEGAHLALDCIRSVGKESCPCTFDILEVLLIDVCEIKRMIAILADAQ